MIFDPNKATSWGRADNVLGSASPGVVMPQPEKTYREVAGADSALVAESDALSKKLGSSPQTVMDNISEARHAANQPDWEVMKKEAPVLYRKAGNKKFAAKVKGDYDNLMKLEVAFGQRESDKPTTFDETVGTIVSTGSHIISSLATIGRGIREAGIEQEEALSEKWLTEKLDRSTEKFEAGEINKDEYDQEIKSILRREELEQVATSSAAKKGIYASLLAEGLQNIETYHEEVAESFAPKYKGSFTEDPSFMRGVSAFVAGGTSLGIAIIATRLTGSSKAGAAILSAAESGSVYKDARAEGKSATEALDYAMAAGVVTYLLEKFGLDRVLKTAGGHARRFFAGITGEVTTEQAQTVVLNAIAKHGYDESRGYLDGIIEATIGGTVGGPAAVVTGHYQDKQDARGKVAEETRARLEATRESITNLEKIDREEYLAHVNEIAESNGEGELFLQGEVLLNAIAESGEDINLWAERNGTTREAIVAAAQTGGDVSLPTANVIHAMKDDQLMQSLVDDLKIRPDDASINSLGVEGENEQAAAVRLRELYDEKVREDATPEQIESLQEQIRAAAKAAGVKGYTQQNVEAQTSLILAGANRWVDAVRTETGTDVTIDDFFNTFQLTVGQPAAGADQIVDQKSVLTEGQTYEQGQIVTDTPEFKAWFGDSKVVAESGEPLVVYHGTEEAFEEFDLDLTAPGGGFWFSEDRGKIERGESGAAAARDIMPVYLSAQKLAGWEEYEKYGLQEIRELGFDGIKLDDDYVIFEPTQIKSVSNRGIFDPTDPNILRQAKIDDTLSADLEKIERGKYVSERLPQEIQRESAGTDLAAITNVARDVHRTFDEGEDRSEPSNHRPEKQRLKSAAVKDKESLPLYQWARENDLLRDSTAFVDMWETTGKGGGVEHMTILAPDGKTVRKLASASMNESWLQYFQRIQIHNSLFPETAYTFLGMTVHDGNLYAMVEQPAIDIENKVEGKGEGALRDDAHSELEKRGFERRIFTNHRGKITQELTANEYLVHPETGIVLHDLSSDNVVQTPTGEFFFIDPLVEMDKSTRADRIRKEGEDFAEAFRQEPLDTDTNAFQAWSEGGEVVNLDEINDYDFKQDTPVVLRVFHGTTHKFSVFDALRGNLESQFGAVNYFTSSEQDASDNYTGEGPDLTQRIGLRSERIERELEDASEEEIQELSDDHGLEFDPESEAYPEDLPMAMARAELVGGEEQAMELFVKVENPFVIGEDAGWIEFVDSEALNEQAVMRVAEIHDLEPSAIEENRDDYEDEIDEARWEAQEETPHRLVDAIQEVSARYGIEASGLAGVVYELGEEARPEDIEQLLRQSEDYQYADDPETGELISSQLVMEVIKEMGFDSIVLKNADQRFESMTIETGTAHVHIFDENKTNIKSATENIGTFDPADPDIFRQRREDGPRGTIQFEKGRAAANISMTPQADLSTFLHEISHFFLEMVRITAQEHGAFTAEWATIKDFLGAEDGAEITREQHEKWAESWERYLAEGKAPSIELQSAFDKFNFWMVSIYRSIKGMPGAALSDEVVNVMDKLLATEDQILEARASQGLFSLIDARAQEQIGADSPEMQEYLETYGLTEEEAARAMDLHKMRDLKSRRAQYKEQASEEWSKLESTRAIKYAIDNGGISDVEMDLYGREGMPKNVGLFRAGGIPLGAVAGEIGVEKDALVSILRGHKKKADYIEQRTAEMEQLHDMDVPADEAIHNASLREQMVMESQLLAKLSNRKRVLENRQISKYAKEQVAKMNQRQVRGVAQTVTALRRARLAANKFIKQGKYAEALEQNEKARLNEQILVEQVRARDNLDKISRRWSRIVKAIKKDPGNYTLEFRDQIAKLTERFLMMKVPLPVEERKTLFDFFAELNADVPDAYDQMMDLSAGTYGTYDWLYNEEIAGSWSALPYERVTNVDDLMKFLSKEGRIDKKDFLLDGTTRVSDVVDELTQYIDGINKGKLNEFSPFVKARGFIRKYGAEQIPLQYILARMDGFKTDFSGKNIEILFNPLAKASADQHLMLKDVRKQLDPILSDLRKSANRFPRILQHVPVPKEFSDPENSDRKLVWTFDKVLAVALNLGNADNTTKMLDGFGWDYQDAMNVISILSDEDLRNVQKIWDVIDTMWPQIAAMHKKINGYTPQRVVSEEFVIEGQVARTVGNVNIPGRGPVTLKGGYYPLKFDPRQSLRQDVQNERQDIMQSQDNLYPSTKTPQGFTIGRTKTAGGKPVMLSLNVLTDHINHVTHHVTHADVLTDIDKITRNSEYKKSVIDAFGNDIEKMIRPLLAHIANPRAGGSRLAVDQFLEGERSRATAYILWYNISVALKQPFSLANLAQAMGGITSMKYIAPEYMTMIKRPDKMAEYIRTVHELSPNMARRAKAIDKDLQKPDKFGRLRKLSGRETVEEALEKFSDMTGPVLIRMMDMAAAYPGWMAAYRQGLDKFAGDNVKAISYADNIISATQPFDRPLDQSKVRATKAGMVRLFTMFSGYTMKYANRRGFYWDGFKTYIKTKGKQGIGPTEFMSHVLLERVAPSLVMTTMLAAVFKDEPPEAEDYLMDLLLFQFAGRYILQDIAAFAFSAGYKADSVLRTPIETGFKLAVDQSKRLIASFDNEEGWQGTMEFFAEMLGYKYKLPIKKAAEKIERTIEIHE